MQLWADMAVDAAENYRENGGNKKAIREGVNTIRYDGRNGEVKYASELTESDYMALLEKVENRELDAGTYIPMRATTPQFFIDVVTEHSNGEVSPQNLPMAATVAHVSQNMEEEDGQSYGEKRPHGLSKYDIVMIAKEMGHPSYIVKQKNGRYAEVVSFYNEKNRKVIVSVDFAAKGHNYNYERYMNGYNSGYYNIIVTQYEHDSLSSYLKQNEVVYDRKKMNGKYQVGSGRIVTFTHDTPFIKDTVAQSDNGVKMSARESSQAEQIYSDRDSAYMDAIKRGDMKTAQKMVEQAAKDSGYTRLFYHGSKKGGGFKIFRDWQYFTENKEYAKRYTDRGNAESLYTTYVKMENPFDTRIAEVRKLFREARMEYGMGELQENGLPDWTDGYDIADFIDENDLPYDSIVLDEGGDMVNGKPVSRGLSYVIRKSNQIKSADIITYDDSGNVIPLSQRFNTQNNDIRYSQRQQDQQAALEKQNGKLLKDVKFSDSKYMELATDPEVNEYELQEMVMDAAERKGFNYRRNTRKRYEPQNDVPWQMFVNGLDSDTENYGEYLYYTKSKNRGHKDIGRNKFESECLSLCFQYPFTKCYSICQQQRFASLCSR